MTLTLLSRAYCHLCDEMLAALRPIADAHGASIHVVDVDADPALEAAYGDDVPVLFAGDPGDGRGALPSPARPGARRGGVRGARCGRR